MNRWVSCTVSAAALSGYFFAAAAQPACAQGKSAGGTLRAVLASAPLPNVVDAPRYFRMVRVSVPPKQAATYNGPIGFVFPLSGSLEVTSGAGRDLLGKEDGLLVGGGIDTTFRATASQPAVFIHVVLLTAAELTKTMHNRPAVVTELYTTTSAIPGLKPGPYEFTLVRVTLPPRMPANPPHRRSGAAIYYIFSGSGLFMAHGKTELKKAGMEIYEPFDLVHQWANPGDAPLVIMQTNISQEGVPAVIFVPEGGTVGPK